MVVGAIRPIIPVGDNKTVLNFTAKIVTKKQGIDTPVWFDVEIWDRVEFYAQLLKPGSYIYAEGKLKGIGGRNIALQAFLITLLDMPAEYTPDACPNCEGLRGQHYSYCRQDLLSNVAERRKTY